MLERRHGGHMDGMSMGSSTGGGFRATNERLSHALWYGIAGSVGLLTLIRVVRLLESRQRRQLQLKDPKAIVSRPRAMIPQLWATATATTREIAYPQPVYFTGRISKYFSPLPVGRWALLACYWALLLCFLWSDTILGPNDPMYAYKWEKVGFRAAWVSVAQIPFIYLLSCKFNPITLLTGISYERFNWLHRWTARAIFLTIIVHWSYFFREWDLANFVKFQMEMMPMVKYGFGAWAVIGWMVLTGFGFVRAQSYEIFVAQHIAAAATLLWLLWMHVPTYASYYIWMAVGFVVFDWSARLVWGLLRNTHVLDRFRFGKPGYSVNLEGLPGNMVRLVIEHADFSWKAGQHVYITIPRLRPLELHPFTIANACTGDKRLEMVIKAHSGFSKSLRTAAEKYQLECTYRAFLSGPWGHPPDLSHYDSIVLIACSSGASFVVPLFQDLAAKQCCARSVTVHWIVREQEHISWYENAIRKAIRDAQKCRFRLQVVLHITRSFPAETQADMVKNSTQSDKVGEITVDVGAAGSSSSSSRSSSAGEETEGSNAPWRRLNGRPTVESMIRPSVEAALGETAVVVCGGLSVTAEARTFVAALSDERAVHKGTGAQGIFLFTETYGW